MRQIAAFALKSVAPERWNLISKWLPGASQYANFGDKLHKGANVLHSCNLEELYLGLVSHWSNPSEIVLSSSEPATVLTGFRPELNGLDDVQKMMALDTLTYLPDDILVKVDGLRWGLV